MKKAKNLTDVVGIMVLLNYDFIYEAFQTLGLRGQRRNVLYFKKDKTDDELVDAKELQEKIGNSFTIEKYNDGMYYHIYRNL